MRCYKLTFMIFTAKKSSKRLVASVKSLNMLPLQRQKDKDETRVSLILVS